MSSGILIQLLFKLYCSCPAKSRGWVLFLVYSIMCFLGDLSSLSLLPGICSILPCAHHLPCPITSFVLYPSTCTPDITSFLLPGHGWCKILSRHCCLVQFFTSVGGHTQLVTPGVTHAIRTEILSVSGMCLFLLEIISMTVTD